MKKLAIIDSFALLHRAWHAIPPLTTKDGTMVNAVFGFTSILLKLLNEIKPDYLVAAFDLPHETFRKKEYKEYKAQREAPEPEFISQINLTEKILKGINIPVLAVPGYEADDVIGSVAQHVYKQHKDIEVIIVSGDNDTLQLVNDRVSVFTMRKGINDTLIYDEAGVKERYGIEPGQLIDMKGLCGDVSDNIPGVKGIGKKGAEELIKTFGSIERLYEKIDSDKIKPRVRELLVSQEKEARQSKWLATIVTNLPVNLDLKKASIDNYNPEKAAEIFQKLEFRSLLSKLPKNNRHLPAVTKSKHVVEYDLIETPEEIKKYAERLGAYKRISIDTETTGLDTRHAELLGASFSGEAGSATFIHLRKPESLAAFKKHVGPIIESAAVEKIGHNIKYDYEVLQHHGMIMGNLYFDTLIAAYLIQPSRGLKLEELAFNYLGVRMENLHELAEKHLPDSKKNDIDVAAIPPDALGQYGAADADMTFRLYEKLEKEITTENLTKLLTSIEIPLIPVLADMETTGISIDVPYLKQIEKKLKADVKKLETKIYKLAGKEFNIASPLQLKEILFETLKIETKGIKRKKTGLSTAASELEKMKDLHPIIPLISDYRELTKLINTYVVPLPDMMDPDDKRIHTNYNQTIAATGRLSSTDPNLQNIPIRTELGRTIRQAFVAPKGSVLLSADYSQIELRLAAIISKDPKMLASFKKGEDIHRRTAAEIHGVALEDVTPDQRRSAKEVNFGVIYGLGSTGLSQRTGMSRLEAKDFIERYFDLYKGVRKYIDDTKALARSQGYVETLFGRKRKLPEIRSSMPMLRAQAERMAINMPLQGTAADLMKLAMIKIAEILPTKFPDAKILLQVHDELVFELPEEQASKAAPLIKKTMENVAQYEIPLVVDVKTGTNWSEMNKIKDML